MIKRKKIITKTPGKLMILGEHAVVYGYPCIATRVKRYLTVEINKSDKEEISSPGVSDQKLVKYILDDFKKRNDLTGNFLVNIKSELTGLGLGSSSAVTVGLVKALYKFLNIEIDNNKLFDICLDYIKVFQPLASGYDLAVSIYNGTIYFSGRNKKSEILSYKTLPLVAGFTGLKADTVKMVDKVAELKKRNSGKVSNIFNSINQIVEDGRKSIISKDWKNLGELMNQNHKLLVKLDVSSPLIDRLIEASISSGAYGAKISGAGGGDCIIALVSKDFKMKVSQAIINAGGKIIEI